MLVTQQQQLLRPSSPNPNPFFFPSLAPFAFSIHYSRCSARKTWFAVSAAPEGPVELPPSTSTIFATDDEPSPLQTATSVLLTGAITVFLFRSLRRRAKRAKETKFRSSGEKKSLAEEAMESLKSVSLSPVSGKSPPSPVQAFLGAVTAGVIALILYKFTTTIEASLNRQTIPDNYSVRQITITIRTIITGMCYLATFVFGANSFGLLLYSSQLAFNSFMEMDNSSSETQASSKTVDLDNSESTNASADLSSDNKSRRESE